MDAFDVRPFSVQRSTFNVRRFSGRGACPQAPWVSRTPSLNTHTSRRMGSEPRAVGDNCPCLPYPADNYISRFSVITFCYQYAQSFGMRFWVLQSVYAMPNRRRQLSAQTQLSAQMRT